MITIVAMIIVMIPNDNIHNCRISPHTTCRSWYRFLVNNICSRVIGLPLKRYYQLIKTSSAFTSLSSGITDSLSTSGAWYGTKFLKPVSTLICPMLVRKSNVFPSSADTLGFVPSVLYLISWVLSYWNNEIFGYWIFFFHIWLQL